MKPSELDADKIRRNIVDNDLVVRFQVEEIQRIEGEIKELTTSKLRCEEIKRRAASRAHLLLRALLLKKGIPTETAELRQQILDAMQEVKRDDITIARQRELQSLIKSLREKLMQICKHPFVTGHVGYRGYSEDDASYNGKRFCLVCKFAETAKWRSPSVGDSREEIYEVLTETPERFIDFTLIDHSGPRFPLCVDEQLEKIVWRPFDETLEALLDPWVITILETGV
jgi:hypothetical protein